MVWSASCVVSDESLSVCVDIKVMYALWRHLSYFAVRMVDKPGIRSAMGCVAAILS